MTTSARASDNGAEHADATIVDTSGATVGVARLTEDGTGRVHLNVKVDGLTPGLHVVAIADLSPARAHANLAAAGWPAEQSEARSAGDAVRHGDTWLAEDARNAELAPIEIRRLVAVQYAATVATAAHLAGTL